MTHAETRARYYRNNKHKWDDYRKKNYERIQEQKRIKHAANPDAAWEISLRRKYKMTSAEYSGMLAKQDGKCAICGNPERAVDPRTRKLRRLAIDHHHGSGKIRALLCMSCNRGLGLFQDDPVRLQMAAEYLRRMT
jgi:hypothetical protein